MPTFADRWLKPTARELSDGELFVEDAVPDETSLCRADAIRHLAHELKRNYVSPNELASILEAFGADGVAAYLRQHKFPQKKYVRHGDFGEVLTGAIFRHAKRYCVPILKLRYKTRPNQPLHGLDIVAFRLSVEPPRVIVAEVKTHARLARDIKIAEGAYQQLAKVLESGLDNAITFVHARFSELEGKHWLANRIISLLTVEKEVERYVVIIHEQAAWSEKIVERLKGVVDGYTKVTVVRISGLEGLIEDSYAAAG